MARTTFASLAVILALALAPGGVSAQTESKLSPAELAERTIHRRAVEAVIWGMAAVNTELMRQEMLEAGGNPGEIIRQRTIKFQ